MSFDEIIDFTKWSFQLSSIYNNFLFEIQMRSDINCEEIWNVKTQIWQKKTLKKFEIHMRSCINCEERPLEGVSLCGGGPMLIYNTKPIFGGWWWWIRLSVSFFSSSSARLMLPRTHYPQANAQPNQWLAITDAWVAVEDTKGVQLEVVAQKTHKLLTLKYLDVRYLDV